jgi:L-iditol 2-dehydrogenase
LHVLPEEVDAVLGALVEPGGNSLRAARAADLDPGDRVLVTGAGPVGLFAAQAARAFGARSVTVSDIADFRLGIASSLGFDTEKPGESDSRDHDVLLECSGAPTALADGLWRLGANGRAAMVGMPKQDVSLPLSRLNVNELTIGLVNRYAHTWPMAIELISSGRVEASSLVTHHFALDGTANALLLAKHVPDSVKAVIHPQQLS